MDLVKLAQFFACDGLVTIESRELLKELRDQRVVKRWAFHGDQTPSQVDQQVMRDLVVSKDFFLNC
jgi:hypothetical protein